MTRKDRPVQLLNAASDEPGRYGETKSAKVIGVRCGIILIQTRIHTWTIDVVPLDEPDSSDALFERRPMRLEWIGSKAGGSTGAGYGSPEPGCNLLN
jgi:hypothetical protein